MTLWGELHVSVLKSVCYKNVQFFNKYLVPTAKTSVQKHLCAEYKYYILYNIMLNNKL